MTFPSTQKTSASHSVANRPATPLTDGDGTAFASEPEGLVSLLGTHAVQRISSLAKARGYGESATALLFEGRLPDRQEDRDTFASWILLLDEPALNVAILKLGNLAVRIDSVAMIEALLKAARLEPAAAFPNVALHFYLVETDEVEAMLPPLVDLLSANKSFGTINIGRYSFESFDLGKLFDALSTVEGLKLTVDECGSTCPDEVDHVADLLSKNQTIHTLELRKLPQPTALARLPHSYMRLCMQLGGQKHLEVLRMSCVSRECQEILGDFIGSSHSVRKFSFSIESDAVMPRLIEGIRKNDTLEELDIKFESFSSSMAPIETSIFPFLALFEKNRCTATSLALDLRGCSAEKIFTLLQERKADRQGLTAVGSLIANNSTLQSLTLCLPRPFDFEIDLLGVGEGLQRNTGLESVFISFSSNMPAFLLPVSCIDQSTWAEFIRQIAKNRTLTEMMFQTVGRDKTRVIHDIELTKILARNKNFSAYVCSRAYIQGAASGLMSTLGYPPDPAMVVAEHLLKQRPHVTARALAMVNKASNENALAARRCEILDLIADRRPGNRPSVDNALRAIAECAFLAPDLIYWMDAEPATYLEVTKRFCEVVGAEVMRTQIIGQFSEPSDLTAHRLAMLEQTIPPDQKHLASVLGKELGYHSIEPTVLRYFAGYKVFHAGSDSTSLQEWCERNQQMPLYRAYLHYQSMDQARHFQMTV